MMKLCPKCHSTYLRERTDIESHRGWLSCSVCRYMKKVEPKLTNKTENGIIVTSKKKKRDNKSGD